MNEEEMGDRLGARTGLSKAAAREAVDSVFAAIGDALANGEKVRLTGPGPSAREVDRRVPGHTDGQLPNWMLHRV